jgi:hypothetical protein
MNAINIKIISSSSTTSLVVKHQKSEIGLSLVKVHLLFGILKIVSIKHHVNNNIVLSLN